MGSNNGPAKRQPAYAHALVRRSLSLLMLPPEEIHERIADVFEDSFQAIYQEELSMQLQKGPDQSLSTWIVLAKLAERGDGWARKMAETHWPSVSQELSVLSLLVRRLRKNSWVMDKYVSRFFDFPLLAVHPGLYRDKELREVFRPNELASRLLGRLFYRRRDGEILKVKFLGLGELNYSVETIASCRDFLLPMGRLESSSPFWKPLIEGARFLANISTDTLADALLACAEIKPHGFLYSILPWPMKACLSAARDGVEISILNFLT